MSNNYYTLTIDPYAIHWRVSNRHSNRTMIHTMFCCLLMTKHVIKQYQMCMAYIETRELLHRLEHTFGLSGFVISWIRSYLTNRSSFVKIDSSSSPSTTISTGVPQGSVLGPLLFVLFISPVANVINPDLSETTNLVSFHQYAYDTQLYIGTNASTLVHQVASIESCTQRVHNWLLNNGLQQWCYLLTYLLTRINLTIENMKTWPTTEYSIGTL